jgi:hypothetical protein
VVDLRTDEILLIAAVVFFAAASVPLIYLLSRWAGTEEATVVSSFLFMALSGAVFLILFNGVAGRGTTPR